MGGEESGVAKDAMSGGATGGVRKADEPRMRRARGERGRKRQRVRRLVLLVSFLLFPVTIFYFSPALIIEGALAGAVVGSTLAFSLQFLLALVLRRAFCGWVCPAGGL